jgi:hypothetical protein
MYSYTNNEQKQQTPLPPPSATTKSHQHCIQKGNQTPISIYPPIIYTTSPLSQQ